MTGKIEGFEDLEVWQCARQLTADIYQLISQSPIARDFVFKNQLRKSALSILSNIAEGFERDGNREFVQLLSIAKGSSGELRAQLIAAFDQHYFEEASFIKLRDQVDHISRMLSNLSQYLTRSEMRGRKFHDKPRGT